MFSLSRREFVDRLLGPNDLDDLTAIWLAWHEDAQVNRRKQLIGYRAVELRLYGFPRSQGAFLKEELERRLKDRRWDYTVDLSDPDNLRVSTPFLSDFESCSLGDWLTLVQTPAFYGLIAFLRLSTHDWPGQPEGPAHAGRTLVLCGLLKEEGYLLKALWPADLEHSPERLYEMTVWPQEEIVLQALEEYQQTKKVPLGPDELFSSRLAQKQSTFLAGLIVFLHRGERRLPWFLTRVIFHSAALALIAGLYFLLPPFNRKTKLFVALALLFGTALGYVLTREAKRVRSLYRNMWAAMKKIYTQAISFEAVDLAELGLKDDPNNVKYTAELEALGCRHLADVRHVPGPSGTIYNRLFVLPADHTYVFLNLMVSTRNFQRYPAYAFFFICTYFEDLRLVTVHETGFRKPILRHVQTRVYPGVHDPALLLAAHRKRVEEQRREGHVLSPLMTAPVLFARMAKDHEESSAAHRKHGYYSWAAAIRQNFKLTRRELLGKIEDK